MRTLDLNDTPLNSIQLEKLRVIKSFIETRGSKLADGGIPYQSTRKERLQRHENAEYHIYASSTAAEIANLIRPNLTALQTPTTKIETHDDESSNDDQPLDALIARDTGNVSDSEIFVEPSGKRVKIECPADDVIDIAYKQEIDTNGTNTNQDRNMIRNISDGYKQELPDSGVIL